MKYMLDTNICIYIIKKKYKNILNKIRTIESGNICISSVTYAELVYGIEKSQKKEKNRVALLSLLSNIDVLDFDMSASDNYGLIRAELEKKGTPIGPLDTMIAAHASSLGYILVTNNEKEFLRVSNLTVENWV